MVKLNRALLNEDDAVVHAIAVAMAANPPRNLRHSMQSLHSFPWRTSAVQSASSLEEWVQRRIDRVRCSDRDDSARLGCDPGAVDSLVKVCTFTLFKSQPGRCHYHPAEFPHLTPLKCTVETRSWLRRLGHTRNFPAHPSRFRLEVSRTPWSTAERLCRISCHF